MKRWFSILLMLLLVAITAGCAHPITMNPDLNAIKGDKSTMMAKSVGYHIPEAAKSLEVTTAGGGGDKLRYFPYRDLEPGLYKALGEVFSNVSRIQNPKDAAEWSNRGISLLITPEIRTVSASESAFTWPPTQFTVDLSCTVSDSAGQTIEVIKVSGYGLATFDEFKSNFSIAAVRASNQALALLIQALSESKRLRQ